MDPQYYPSSNPSGGMRQLVRLAIWLLVVISVILLILTFGKGKLGFDVPPHSLVYVNGHRIATDSAHLQTGSYSIKVVSPTTELNEGSHRVYLWPTSYKPTLKQRSPNAILSSVIGANGQYGKPSISDVKWFDGDTWMVGEVGPGNGTPIALHFGDNGWQVGYYPVGSYPQSLKALTPSISAYIQQLEIKYAN